MAPLTRVRSGAEGWAFESRKALSEYATRVNRLLASRGCPFIFTTGYGRSGIPQGHAGRPVLQKPFRMDELASTLKATLASR